MIEQEIPYAVVQKPLNSALTVDLEDYFHVSAFDKVISQADWSTLESRVVQSTKKLLKIFTRNNAKATFFCLGIVAKQYPSLIKEIHTQGHEIASHSWNHQRVYNLTKQEFINDLLKSKNVLEDIIDAPVKGYRAPSFSFDLSKSPWVYECLAKTGYLYSSSQHPIKHDHYGQVDGMRTPYIPQKEFSVCEIPITTVEYAGKRFPCGGGGFFRVLPLKWFISAHKMAQQQGVPINFYLHPWEIDPDQPRISGIQIRTRLRHYVGLKHCAVKLDKLLQTRVWNRMDSIYANYLPST